jgi:UDP-glucose:(heptosyl)LPS alpha-1,3-glucosyltransferase
LRVALVVDRFDPLVGGLEQWTVGFAAHLLRRGHQVHVVAFGEGNHALPVRCHVLPHARSMIERARRVATCVRTLDLDVVHDAGIGWSGQVFHPHTGSRFLCQAAVLAGHSRLRRLATAISPRGWLYRARMKRLEQQQAENARCIVALSHGLRTLLAQRHRVSLDRIAVIPNGVDTQRFAPARLAGLRQQARQTLGLQDEVLFLAVAHNLRLKGVDNAMRALAVLRRDGARVRLAVAGGVADTYWRGLAVRLGIRESVEFLGPVSDMAPLFAAADAVVHPTRWDACSLVTIEGLASGLPVITTPRNGASELIADGHSGILLRDPEDVPALAAHMRTLLDPATRLRIGAAAREAAACYDRRDNFRAIEGVLLQVAAECRQ